MFTEARSSFVVRLILALILGLGGLQPTKPVLAATIMVTNTADSGAGSLRQAIASAAPGDTIKFDSSLAGLPIMLESDLIINKDLTIDGSGLSSQVTINGRNLAHLVLQSSPIPPTVTISNLTIANGYTSGKGGAILSSGHLTLIDSTLRNNHAASGGGAVSSIQLTLRNTTLYQNQADAQGGAILMEGNGGMTIVNSTVTQNQAVSSGGAIYMRGTVSGNVSNSSFAGNYAANGTEIALEGNTYLALQNTIFVCTFVNSSCYTHLSNSVINPINSILGVGIPANFGLADLANNGGPTQTMALSPESPLVDAGDDAVCASPSVDHLDQRGVARPQGGHCDIGAYELSYLTVSGNAGIGGATLKYGYGLFTTADNNGTYLIKVLPGWSGTVIPSKQGYSFNPVKKDYANVQSNQASQNYSATANTYTYPGNPGATWRISVPNGGGQSNNNSYNPSISADGRYVAYWSFAWNLVPGDGSNDIVVYDNQTGQTSAASVDSNGAPLSCNSYNPSISADGRYVAFYSCAGGGGMYWIVYVYDRHTGILNDIAYGFSPSLSADGRYVAYTSTDNDSNQARIFVEDLFTRVGIQISISSTGGQPDGDSYLSSISADGRYVAFRSLATNLVSNDTNGAEDVFVYDLQTKVTTRVSVSSSGIQANGASFTPSISPDGRYVAFDSSASNLVSNDTNGVDDAFVHDLQTGITTRVSINSSGTQGNQASNQAHLFGNGRYVAFRSLATNLISGDTNSAADIFIHDRQTGQTRRVSVDSNGGQANGPSSATYSQEFSISEDGKYLAFSSDAANLVSGDTNSSSDIFVHEMKCLTCIEVSIGGDLRGDYDIPIHESTRVSFSSLNNGPVKLENKKTSILAAERVIYKANGIPTSFSEMMALPDGQLDNTYWLPWYNNKDLDTQLRIGNVSSIQASVQIWIGENEISGCNPTNVPYPYILGVGQSIRVSCPGANNGPLKIQSMGGQIVAAERVIYKVNGIPTSFSEIMALPNSQLDSTYWLPWYNNKDLDTQLRFGNVSDTQATVRIWIGGQEKTTGCVSVPSLPYPYVLDKGKSIRVSCPSANNGPVKIQSTGGNIVAAERVIYTANNLRTSFSEMMALPNKQLDSIYWLPWYNDKDLDTQLRIGNISTLPDQTATVHVYSGGQEVTGCLPHDSPYILGPGASLRISCGGKNSGPVQIKSDIPIVAAERVIYKVNNTGISFSEMMALPDSQLDTTYWLPWYNNVDLDTQLRFGVP